MRVGQSYPFAPPVGLMFVLWDDDALRNWLAKEPTIPLRTDTERLDRVIAECRADGHLVERLTPGGRRLYSLMAGMSSTCPTNCGRCWANWCPTSVSGCICAGKTRVAAMPVRISASSPRRCTTTTNDR